MCNLIYFVYSGTSLSLSLLQSLPCWARNLLDYREKPIWLKILALQLTHSCGDLRRAHWCQSRPGPKIGATTTPNTHNEKSPNKDTPLCDFVATNTHRTVQWIVNQFACVCACARVSQTSAILRKFLEKKRKSTRVNLRGYTHTHTQTSIGKSEGFPTLVDVCKLKPGTMHIPHPLSLIWHLHLLYPSRYLPLLCSVHVAYLKDDILGKKEERG